MSIDRRSLCIAAVCAVLGMGVFLSGMAFAAPVKVLLKVPGIT